MVRVTPANLRFMYQVNITSILLRNLTLRQQILDGYDKLPAQSIKIRNTNTKICPISLTIVAKSLRPDLIYEVFCCVIILHLILLHLYHLYSKAKSDIISIY